MSEIGADRPDELESQEDFPRIEFVRDVLVVPSPGHRANEDDWMANPPVDAAVDLGNGVVIERIEHELAEQVLEASTPRGLNFDAIRQFGQLYSFWREVPPMDTSLLVRRPPALRLLEGDRVGEQKPVACRPCGS
jgi:hypothetical protein